MRFDGMSGCCNYVTRTEGKVAPYARTPHPYYCTAEVWQDVDLTYLFAKGDGEEESVHPAM